MPEKENPLTCENLQPQVAANLDKKLEALGDEGICTMLDISANSPSPVADITKLLKESGLSPTEIATMNAQAATLAKQCPDHYDAVLDGGLPRLRQAKTNTNGCKDR